MLRFAVLLAAVAVLSGCETAPERWVGANSRGISVDQAMTQCRANSDGVLASSMGQGALFAAAMQQQAINDCMATYGYRLE